MSKETLVFVLGFIVCFSPFIGISRDHKEWLLIGIGTILMMVGYRLRRLSFLRSLDERGVGERRADVFVENAGFNTNMRVEGGE
ncbi:MAG TPA: hypothetical protein VFV22_02375 [Candidatus Paceibacterota bacterium]|nr:hypothetical protein [Candidatus Paceibacterota bacterium]